MAYQKWTGKVRISDYYINFMLMIEVMIGCS